MSTTYPAIAENTCGTGAFFLQNTGSKAVTSENDLLTTTASQRTDEPATNALERSILTTGAAIEWLEDSGLIDDTAETPRLANQIDGSDDVFVVPASSGLGAPHWDGRGVAPSSA